MENLTREYMTKELTALTKMHFLRALVRYNLSSADTKMPKISFDIKGNRTAGKAYVSPEQWEISYNLGIARENWSSFIERTVVHEVSHIICSKIYPYASAHGYEWQSIMNGLGYTPSRCHSYNVTNVAPARKTQKWIYTCQCLGNAKNHSVGKKVNAKIQSGSIYTCRNCHAKLIYSGQMQQ